MGASRNKFRLTRFIIFKASWFFKVLSRFRTYEKRILIVKVDAIGDYVLFRNYLEALSKSEKYQGYSIDLLGNTLWKDLALEYDSGYVSNFIFVDSESYLERPLSTLNLGWRLFKHKYELVLQSTYSKTLMSNAFCGMAAGRESITFNSFNELHKYKKRTDKFYTSLIDLPSLVNHEFERNRYFFSEVTNSTLNIQAPSFPIKTKDKQGIIIFPGSSVIKRNWSQENFLEIIKKLLEHTAERIIIAGAAPEMSIAEGIMRCLPDGADVIDETGKLTLVDFVNLISNCRLLISNETSAVHIAVACGSKSICIMGGGHFNRFSPYPDNIPHSPICVYANMPCFNCNWECVFQSAPMNPFPCIDNVGVEQVWLEIVKVLEKDGVLKV